MSTPLTPNLAAVPSALRNDGSVSAEAVASRPKPAVAPATAAGAAAAATKRANSNGAAPSPVDQDGAGSATRTAASAPHAARDQHETIAAVQQPAWRQQLRAVPHAESSKTAAARALAPAAATLLHLAGGSSIAGNGTFRTGPGQSLHETRRRPAPGQSQRGSDAPTVAGANGDGRAHPSVGPRADAQTNQQNGNGADGGKPARTTAAADAAAVRAAQAAKRSTSESEQTTLTPLAAAAARRAAQASRSPLLKALDKPRQTEGGTALGVAVGSAGAQIGAANASSVGTAAGLSGPTR